MRYLPRLLTFLTVLGAAHDALAQPAYVINGNAVSVIDTATVP
jgi:hypothetical protein